MNSMKHAALLLLLASLAVAAPARSADARLNKSFRKPAQAGWIFVHLEGKPSEIGFQHGFLLAPEIADAQKAIKLALTHESKDWNYFRAVSEALGPGLRPPALTAESGFACQARLARTRSASGWPRSSSMAKARCQASRAASRSPAACLTSAICVNVSAW